jgi:hypothetical protein
VPLTAFVWEAKPGVVRVEYHLPSWQFGQFGLSEVSALAATLDSKSTHLIEDVIANANQMKEDAQWSSSVLTVHLSISLQWGTRDANS